MIMLKMQCLFRDKVCYESKNIDKDLEQDRWDESSLLIQMDMGLI